MAQRPHRQGVDTRRVVARGAQASAASGGGVAAHPAHFLQAPAPPLRRDFAEGVWG
eukprot:CAMPEP_0176263724 /NCGR_PEP_ID=MMETSP0121_2-20121125/41270_1 /TAXON_ID=160619 /ORGANISM="Kryptoperidinium foliaceum, Strain CCMP 1326" /LENGTH=55 /DNA_ID=CAMNT_0017603723 /DNA_START=150 /DNA_END=317 /DNA_ORIENTATION=-